MNIPERVKVGGITYAVIIADDWAGREQGDDGECRWHGPQGNVIYLNAALTPESLGLTFIHECLHAMNSTMDHEFLDSLSQQIYALGVDNDLWKNGDR